MFLLCLYPCVWDASEKDLLLSHLCLLFSTMWTEASGWCLIVMTLDGSCWGCFYQGQTWEQTAVTGRAMSCCQSDSELKCSLVLQSSLCPSLLQQHPKCRLQDEIPERSSAPVPSRDRTTAGVTGEEAALAGSAPAAARRRRQTRPGARAWTRQPIPHMALQTWLRKVVIFKAKVALAALLNSFLLAVVSRVTQSNIFKSLE